jgi:hypothetical protein
VIASTGDFLRARIKNAVLRCARADLPSDEATGLYFDARSAAAGIIRAELSPADQAVYDELRAGYLKRCADFRGERLEERTWVPLDVLLPVLKTHTHIRAPRPTRPRGRRTVRRAVSAARKTARAGPDGDDPDPADLVRPGESRALRRGPALRERPSLRIELEYESARPRVYLDSSCEDMARLRDWLGHSDALQMLPELVAWLLDDLDREGGDA